MKETQVISADLQKLKQQMSAIVRVNREERKKRERNLQLLSQVTTRR